MSKNPLPHLDKPDEETIDKMKSSDYSKNQKIQDAINSSISTDSKRKYQQKFNWFSKHWLELLSVLIALIALIVSLFK
jgi:hypothetical protein